ncbi:MAG TPA: SulP family inorganic anion transporter [Sphingobium sp.]
MRRQDVIAGISVAGLMLPEAVAYAGIAGLPPQRAIFGAVIGCLVYGLVGRSRFAIVSPTSSSAAILAALLASLPGSVATKAALATIAVAFVGALFLLAALARLGGMTGFISRPVLRGFAFGLAITIILKQLPAIAGTPIHAPDLGHLVLALIAAAPHWNHASVATGLAALIGLIGLRRFPALPGAVIVLGLGIAASMLLRLPDYGVAIVGVIPMTLAWPALPRIGWAEISGLAQFTVPLVLILFAESWGTIRALALRHGDTVDSNREIRALGFANLASAIVQGMPVGAGFSAGSANEAAGAGSRAAALTAALGLALLILVATPLIARLPEPVLAAVVIAALTHALDPAPLFRFWRIDRDQYVALGAALGVIMFGVLNGMLLAIILSVGALVQRLASPRLAQLGRLGTSHDFVDRSRHPDAVVPEGMMIWRPAQPLFFANADAILNAIASRTQAAGCKAIIVSLEESFDLDSSAFDALGEYDALLHKAGVRLQLARVHDHVRDLLARGGLSDLLARCSYSVEDAVLALTAAPASEEK